MRQITISKISGRYVYDEAGRAYRMIGNGPHYVGERAYADGNIVFGRHNTPMTPPPRLPKGVPGWPVVAGYPCRRVIPASYYQDGSIQYEVVASPFNYLDTNFNLVELDYIKGGNSGFDYGYPGLYNTGRKLVKDYAGNEISDTRLIARIDGTNVTQRGFFKVSTGNNKYTIPSATYWLNSIDSDIDISDKDYTIIKASYYTFGAQNYVYQSYYSQLGDTSPIYTGPEMTDLTLTADDEAISPIDALADAKKRLIEQMETISQAPAGATQWPTGRPAFSPAVVWWTVTDKNYNRIDDRLDETGSPLQISNVKLFEASIIGDLGATISFAVIGVMPYWITCTNPYGDNVAQWTPVVVEGHYTYRLTADAVDLIYFDFKGHFLECDIYMEPYSGSAGTMTIGANDNITPYSVARIYGRGGTISCKMASLGSIGDKYNNIAIPQTVVVSKSYTIPLTETAYYSSEKKAVLNNDSQTLIKNIASCDFGISVYNSKNIILINNHGYMEQNGKILKSVDLSKMHSGYTPLVVNLEFSKDVKKILGQV